MEMSDSEGEADVDNIENDSDNSDGDYNPEKDTGVEEEEEAVITAIRQIETKPAQVCKRIPSSRQNNASDSDVEQSNCFEIRRKGRVSWKEQFQMESGRNVDFWETSKEKYCLCATRSFTKGSLLS